MIGLKGRGRRSPAFLLQERGQCRNGKGEPVKIDGLWAIGFADEQREQDLEPDGETTDTEQTAIENDPDRPAPDRLFFTAGPRGGMHGVVGFLRPVSAAPTTRP